ncbi:MAG: hypothetical protein DRN26_01795 [Thermoplasmata archaeon]|nr:MAG: hypothetical protein DRN26_01795 [Thermoplasmata archaeon]
MLTGGLTVYFGEGRTRIAGVLQLVIGVVAIIVMIFLYALPSWSYFVQAFIALLGGVVGALIGAGIFLVSIIKA